jgi:hypothetical protein
MSWDDAELAACANSHLLEFCSMSMFISSARHGSFVTERPSGDKRHYNLDKNSEEV